MPRLLLAAFLLLGVGTDKTYAQVCGENLEGYNVTMLSLQPSWLFQVDSKECIRMPGLKVLDCQVEFAICHELSSDDCGGPSAVCMSVNTNFTQPPGPVFSYSLGSNSDFVAQPNPPGAPEGFTYNFSSGSNFTNCSTSAHIMMIFQCDKSAIWDYKNPENNNITKFVSFDWIDGSCMFIAYLNYSGACMQEAPIEPYVCELPGYDVATLANASQWIATPPLEGCYYPDGFAPIGGVSCTFFFSFCKPLTTGSCQNSVFCESMDTTPIVFFSFGTYSSDIAIEASLGTTGFVLEYEKGTVTNNCPGGLFSTVSFVCNEDANWQYLIDYNVTEYMTAGYIADDCQYKVIFEYSGACYVSSTSIVGWILMAVVIGIALIYLVTGIVVQYVRGRRGIHLIPNIDFWKLFLVLFLEGCRFSLDIVTCYQLHSSLPKSVANKDYEAL